jgi:penicillin amidase
LRRLLFAVNILIGLAIVAAAGIYYWVFYRALPQTSGSVPVIVSQPVEITRDGHGFPHIKARNLDDAWFAQGYATAEDRMWQMDTLRRLAAGELAEIIGPAALESDREARRLRLRRLAEKAYTELTPSDKEAMAAYARGVNAYIESHRGRYGFEFLALGYDPRPWSVVDSLLIGLHMFRTLTSDWRTKIVKAQMLSTGDRDKVNYLFPYRGGGEFLPGGDVHPGSNAWAVSGAHTASGKPLLSNDMHLEFSIPGIWHMAHIEAPGMNVEGVALPGMPGILSGHNDRIAWGETNLGFDVQDLYVERIDLRSGQYAFQNRLEQARPERELIVIHGQRPEEVTNWVTRHGPVFQQAGGTVLTLKWTAAEPGAVADVFLDIDRARNWEDFKHAISRFGGPGQNFVYADVDGNIGYHASGLLPVRRTYRGDVPVDGSSGNFEWQGMIPFDELPQSYNPSNGLVVSANQNPFPPDYPYQVSGIFASAHRSRQIYNMLRASGDKIKAEDDLRIQKDVYSGFELFLAHEVLEALKSHQAEGAAYQNAIDLLAKWNGQMDRDEAAPLIATLIFQHLRRAIAERASPNNGALYEPQMSAAVVERMLRERPAGWFGDYGATLVQSFADAIEEGQRMQGADPRQWKWGKYEFLAVNHPVGTRIPFFRNYFDIAATPMSGGPNTVKQTKGRVGPSERITNDLGDWNRSLMNLPIGESGDVASRHYRDEWDAYYNGQSFAAPFTGNDSGGHLTLTPRR